MASFIFDNNDKSTFRSSNRVSQPPGGNSSFALGGSGVSSPATVRSRRAAPESPTQAKTSFHQIISPGDKSSPTKKAAASPSGPRTKTLQEMVETIGHDDAHAADAQPAILPHSLMSEIFEEVPNAARPESFNRRNVKVGQPLSHQEYSDLLRSQIASKASIDVGEHVEDFQVMKSIPKSPEKPDASSGRKLISRNGRADGGSDMQSLLNGSCDAPRPPSSGANRAPVSKVVFSSDADVEAPRASRRSFQAPQTSAGAPFATNEVVAPRRTQSRGSTPGAGASTFSVGWQ